MFVTPQRAKAAWVRLIRKVYEADPLQCPRCTGPMRVIALIDDPVVVREILTHPGRWQPEAQERSPPVPEAWPAHASFLSATSPFPSSPEAARKEGSWVPRAPALA